MSIQKIIGIAAISLIAFDVFSQDFELTEEGLIKAKGFAIGKVIKTKRSNILTGTIAEFTIYDVANVPRFLFEGNDGKIIFLDDKKSFLPRVCDATARDIAKFFASDSILKYTGFNDYYRDGFIKKYRGYNARTLAAEKTRDRTTPIQFIESQILQNDQLIGSYDYFREPDSEKHKVIIRGKDKNFIATIIVNAPDRYNMVSVFIMNAEGSELKTFTELRDRNLYRKGIYWLVNNGFL